METGEYHYRFVLDTNVIIDFHVCDGLQYLFKLKAEFLVIDMLDCNKPSIGDLKNFGVKIKHFNKNEVIKLMEMGTKYRALGVVDIANIILSCNEKAILLTGDAKLTNVAKKDFNLKANGTLWILDELIAKNIISPLQACEMLEKMIGSKRRLPNDECEKRIHKWSKIFE